MMWNSGPNVSSATPAAITASAVRIQARNVSSLARVNRGSWFGSFGVQPRYPAHDANGLSPG